MKAEEHPEGCSSAFFICQNAYSENTEELIKLQNSAATLIDTLGNIIF